ncbi:hypothetical protein BH10PSE12_BH10PSE12_21360 [soil metagenome]
MDMEDNLPRRADDALAQLNKQDLDPFSVSELDARISALEAEIVRTRAKRDHAVKHKASADALFRK